MSVATLGHGAMNSHSPKRRKPKNKKRKSDDIPDANPDGAGQRSKPKAKRRKKELYGTEAVTFTGINPSFAQLDGQLLCDHIARKSKRFESDLSLLELEERRLPGQWTRELLTFGE